MCIEWNTWVGGSCQSTCGSGLKVHTRTCQDVQNNVLTDNSNCELLSPEDSSETRECEEVLPPCPGIEGIIFSDDSCLVFTLLTLQVWTDWKYGPCTSSSGVEIELGRGTVWRMEQKQRPLGVLEIHVKVSPVPVMHCFYHKVAFLTSGTIKKLFLRFQKLWSLRPTQDWYKRLWWLLGKSSYIIQCQCGHSKRGCYCMK